MDSEITRPRTIDVVFTVVVGLWVIGVTWVVQIVAWAIEQVLAIEGLAMPAWSWPLAVWINAVVAGVPCVLLALLATTPAVRGTARAWSVATLALGVLGSIRAIPIVQNEIYLAVLGLVATVIAIGLAVWWRGSWLVTPSRLWYAAAAGLAMLLPWLWVGALGGLLETLLAGFAAAAIGAVAALLAGSVAGSGVRGGTGSRLLAGLAIGVPMLVLAAGTGGTGVNLAVMLAVPLLGFVAAVLAPARLAVNVLIAVAVVGPLGFVEPEETLLLLGFHDVGYWALIGAAVAAGIAAVLAVLAVVGAAVPRTGKRSWSRRLAPATAVAALIAAAVVYPAAGHPGFFGERLFVVMKTQADLRGMAKIPDLTQRRRAVYEKLVDTAVQTQASLRAKLRAGGYAFTPYYLVNGIEVDAGPAARRWLSARPDVSRVLYSPQSRPIPSQGPPERGNLPAPTGPDWNIKLVHADQVWEQGDTGKGIVIGSSDSGVDGTHPALAGNFRGGDDSWFDPAHHSRTPVDYNGHGTHTLGTAVGTGGIGVAPGATWVGCVNLARNLGNPPDYLNCMQFMLAPFRFGGDPFTDGRPQDAVDIATNSWGCPTLEGCDLRSLQPAVDALTAAGIFFVAAAGNEGPRCSSIDDPPAIYPNTFTVGAVDSESVVASFSSRGPVHGGAAKPDVVAPGVDVVSALPGGGYGRLSGTSMATPHVAGVVALIWSAHPELRGNIPETAEILRRTAIPVAVGNDPLAITGDCGPTDQTGSGLIDANGAVYSIPLRR